VEKFYHDFQKRYISLMKMLHEKPSRSKHVRTGIIRPVAALDSGHSAPRVCASVVADKRLGEDVSDFSCAEVLRHCMKALQTIDVGFVQENCPIPRRVSLA